MDRPIIEVSGLSKLYRLGEIGASSLHDAVRNWWDGMRGKKVEPNSRTVRDFWALRDVSFKVQPGEVVGILGRNGAGKSTLLKLLSRITEPTSGKAILRGRMASLLEVGTGFHPDLSGRENIFLNGAILGMKRSEIARRFDQIVDFAEIGQFVDTPVKRYSSGMYTRLAFAIAAHLEAEILLVDEVLAVGDSGFQKKCMGKMKGIASTGRTVLFVSHNLVAMEQLCGRCLHLASGELRRVGPSREVVAEYNRDFAAGGDQRFDQTRLAGDGRVKLHSWRVTNSRGEEHRAPTINETVEIHLRLTVNEAIAHPCCGIDVWNSQGVMMLSVTSEDHRLELPPMEEGELDFVVRLRHAPFIPGSYTATIRIMSPQWHIYAAAENAISFEVSQSPVFGTKEIDHRYGCVYIPVDYDWTPTPSGGKAEALYESATAS